MISAVYAYSFSVWPSETWGFDKAVFQVFEAMGARVEMPFTPEEFERFRSSLSHSGFTLREIERALYHEPEPVN